MKELHDRCHFLAALLAFMCITSGLSAQTYLSPGGHWMYYSQGDTPPELLGISCEPRILSVPEYLFGSATYDTPIVFYIKGVEKALIGKMVVIFRWDGGVKELDITGRMSVIGEDGKVDPRNNSSI